MNPEQAVKTEVVHEVNAAVWRAWKEKGMRQDRRGAAGRMIAVKGICIAALLVTAIFWNIVAPYASFLKPIVTVGAIVVMCQAIAARRYGFAAMFVFIAVLFNPFLAVFGTSTLWDFAIVVASVIPFVASLLWLKSKLLSSSI